MSDFSDDLGQPVGGRHSGRARYAAAMALYHQGRLGPAALEVYRICSLLDNQDPTPMLTEVNVTVPKTQKTTGAVAVETLVGAIDLYLSTLPGPGVAEVRMGLNTWRGGPVTLAPQPNQVLDRHLGPALDQLLLSHPDLAHAIAGAAPHLKWITYDGYPPDQIGAAFATGHCYASILGEEGTIHATDYDLGLFLVAPHVLYRDHRHAAPELYAPLTGPHGWRFGPDRPLMIKPAHAPVWNDPFRPHLTKVGPTPFLAVFGWTSDVRQVAQVVPASDWPALEALRLDPETTG